MIVSHKHRLIFLKTRKTGGTSVELALRALCGPDDIITQVTEDRQSVQPYKPQNYLFRSSKWPVAKRMRWLFGWRPTSSKRDMEGVGYFGHATAAEIRGGLGEKIWSSYFKFTIERNPWDRHVSHYYYTTKGRANPPSFEQFVMSGRFVDNWPIYAIDDHVAADHIIRYENLSEGFSDTLNQIGLAAPTLSNAKGGFRPRGASYRDLYDDETREIVARRHQREIDHFGWTF